MKKILSLLFLCTTILWSDLIINTENLQNKYDDFTIAYYEDFSSNLGYKEIINVPFTKTTSNKFALGSFDHPAWFKIELYNPDKKQKELIFALNEVFYDEVSLFYETNDSLIHKKSGIKVDLTQREINNPNAHFKITLHPQTTTTYYVKVDSLFGTFGEFLIFDLDYYHNNIQKESFFYTLYLGAIVAIALYNLFLYLYLKNKIYLYYFGYTFCFGLWAGGLFGGMAFYYIPIEYSYSLHVTTPLATIFLMLFSNEVLKVKQNYAKLYKFFKIHIYLLILSAFSIVFFDYFKISFGFVNLVVCYIFFIYFYLALKQIFLNNKVAKLYLVAIGFFLITVGILSLMTIGILPNNFYTRYFFLAGSFIEIVLLSLLLAYRIDVLQKNYQITLQEEITRQTQSLNIKNNLLTKVLDEKEELLKEMFHRVKNNFQILISMLYIEINNEKSIVINQKIENIISKLFSMSIVHDMLYGKSGTHQIEVKPYFKKLSQHLIMRDSNITIEAGDFYLAENIVKSLGLIVNELFINSLKYTPAEHFTVVNIKIFKVDNRIFFEYIDNSHGYNNQNSGYGTEFINTTLSKLDNVNIAIDTNNKVHYKVEFNCQDYCYKEIE